MKNILSKLTVLFSAGKTAFGRIKTNKTLLALCCALLLLVSAAVTFAALSVISDPIKNVFGEPTLENEIEETFSGEEKSSIKIHNTGSVEEFVRVAMVFNWKNSDGEVSARSVKPEDYTFSVNETDWVRSGKYWYHTAAVKGGEKTAEFLAKDTVIALTDAGKSHVPDGYFFSVEILTEAVQSNPDAVKDAWGLDAENGALKFEEVKE